MNSYWEARPGTDEYGTFYQRYIDKLGEGNILKILADQKIETSSFIQSLEEERALYRYKEGKWTVKEVIGHLIDTERVFMYRALSIGRNDSSELPGFNQDDYVKAGDFNHRSTESLNREYQTLRASTVSMFKGFTEEMLTRKGIANNYSLSLRAIPFIIAGHERHHLNILNQKYII